MWIPSQASKKPWVKIKGKNLQERTGYSKRIGKLALNQLREAPYVVSTRGRGKYGDLGANIFLLINPTSKDPWIETGGSMFASKIAYFTVPRCWVQSNTQIYRWSLSHCTSSETVVYTSICYLASKQNSNRLKDKGLIRLISGLGSEAFDKAIDGLEDKGLILGLELCDPFTGLPVAEETEQLDPHNWYTVDGKQANFNFPLSPQFMDKLFQSLGIEYRIRGDDYFIACVYHQP